jgi:hypothetical protein
MSADDRPDRDDRPDPADRPDPDDRRPDPNDRLEERYADLVDDLTGIAGVTRPAGGSGFGRSSLRYQGKIFAMFVRGHLVLKLPANRVDALLADGEGIRFDANKGTPMKEWLSLDPDSDHPWLPLAREALDFAKASRR